MNKYQVTKRTYLAPCVKVCPVSIESSILAASPVSGGHKDAEDDEELSAKQFYFDEEERLGQNGHSLWED